MTIAQGARSQLLIKAQTAFGTLATGNYTKKKFVTHTLDLVKGAVKDPTIRSDREISDFRLTTKNGQGDIVVSLAYLDFEDLLASTMFNPWASSFTSLGVTPQWLSIEDGALDISQFRLHQDMLVSKAVIKMTPAGIVTATFTMVGSTMTQNATTGGGTAVAAGTNPPFDALRGSIYDDAAESGSALAIVTGLDLTIDNQAKPQFAIGNQAAALIEYGMADVSGQMTLFYQDAVMANRFIAETEFGLSFSLTDLNGHGMEFQMGRVKLTGNAVPVGNPQSRIMTAPFQALRPTTTVTVPHGLGTAQSALIISEF